MGDWVMITIILHLVAGGSSAIGNTYFKDEAACRQAKVFTSNRLDVMKPDYWSVECYPTGKELK